MRASCWPECSLNYAKGRFIQNTHGHENDRIQEAQDVLLINPFSRILRALQYIFPCLVEHGDINRSVAVELILGPH